MTIHSVTHAQSNSWNQEPIVKEYQFSPSTTLKVMYTETKGVYGLLQDGGKITNVSFNHFEGIPKKLKFDQEILARSYFKDVYFTLRRSENNQVTIVVNSCINGGGGSHSHHTSYSYTVAAPPPPKNTPVSYSAGFPIRSLFLTPHIAGNYANAVGAPGSTQFSVNFSSNDYGAQPDVKIHVWKKDYYANRIAQLQQMKAENFQAKANELVKLQAAQANLGMINQKLQSLQNNKAIEQSHEKNRQQVVKELATLKTEMDKDTLLLTDVTQKINTEGPNIRTMIELINLINSLGINIFQPNHLAIHHFAAKFNLNNPLLDSVNNSGGLLGTTLTLLNKVVAEVQKSKGKDVVALIGNTGTGKSTAVNYLLGVPLVPTPDGKSIKVAEGQQEIAKIGHHLANSETLYTQVYEKNGIPYVLADCGGFFDTRGTSNDMAVVTSLKQALESAKSVKLVLCFDSRILDKERGRYFYETVGLALKTLLKSYKDHANSVMVMLTKPAKGLDGVMFDFKEAFRAITEIMNDLPEGSEQKELYKFLLRENGKFICVCDPLVEANRKNIHQLISEISAIKNTKEAFQVACSANSQVELIEEMTKTAVKANDLLTNHSALTAKVKESQQKYQALNAKLADIVKQKGLVDVVIKSEEVYLQTNTLVATNASIQQINQQITTLQAKITALETEVTEKNNSAIIVYHSQGGAWTVTDLTTGAAV